MKIMSTENRWNESTFRLWLLLDFYYQSRIFLTPALIGIVSPAKLNQDVSSTIQRQHSWLWQFPSNSYLRLKYSQIETNGHWRTLANSTCIVLSIRMTRTKTNLPGYLQVNVKMLENLWSSRWNGNFVQREDETERLFTSTCCNKNIWEYTTIGSRLDYVCRVRCFSWWSPKSSPQEFISMSKKPCLTRTASSRTNNGQRWFHRSPVRFSSSLAKMFDTSVRSSNNDLHFFINLLTCTMPDVILLFADKCQD